MPAKVTAEFNSAWANAFPAVKEAQNQENQLSDCPLPIGFVGVGVVSDIVLDLAGGKDMGCRMAVTIIDDPVEAGKKVKQYFSLKETENSTMKQAIARMFDNMENMGMPEEIRKKEGLMPNDIANWWMSEERKVAVRVVEDKKGYNGADRRAYFNKIRNAADMSSSMSPGEEVKVVEYQVGQSLNFLSQEWTIVAVNSDTVEVTNATGERRTIAKNDLASMS